MAAQGWFVTGTDTEIGKTHVACGLLRLLAGRGLQMAGFKPVATGCEVVAGGLRNADALALRQAGTVDVSYEILNPYAFLPPIAPHLAAREAGVAIRPEPILHAFAALNAQADAIVVEGAGGWRVPLGDDWDMADLAAMLDLPVILVVGMRLGCINHALLSAEAIGPRLCGWVANAPQPAMAALAGNLQTLQDRMPAPCLGVVRHGQAAEAALDGRFFAQRRGSAEASDPLRQ